MDLTRASDREHPIRLPCLHDMYPRS
jgi:hypothetical protein